MSAADQRTPPPPAPAAHFGVLLREWRATRRLSQLDLALEAEISSRHLSYIETGKAQPSRDMVERLAAALGMPLRESNALLVAAGYAPKYRETALSTPEMAPLERAVELILEQQEPYPALVTNRHWDVLRINRAAARLFQVLRDGAPVHPNVLHQVFDPGDVRPLIANWEEVAGELIRHLHEEIAAAPSDARARRLRDEVLAYPGVPEGWRTRQPLAAPLPILTTAFRKGDLELRFFSSLTRFSTPLDVTLDELRIECMFPADDATAQRCRRLADSFA